jgi:hypothetical protein
MIIKNKYKMFANHELFIGCKHYFYILFCLLPLITSCEKWYDTKDVSHVSQLPKFEITGGEFNSFIVVDSGEYTDPGAKAFEGDNELDVYSYGEVDLTKTGAYILNYYAENSDGIFAIGERIVTVTSYDVSNNDLSGKYEGTIYSPLVEMKVTRVNEKGLYKCTEILGVSGSEVKGRFVDIGDHKLVLLPGKGDFGAYAMSEGYFTLSTLAWTISLRDEPYNGLDIGVVWYKVE